MNKDNSGVTRPQVKQQPIDYKILLTQFVVNWYWFVLSIVLCILFAGAYLWFKPATYSATGKMQIIDKTKQNSGLSAGMAMLNSLPMGLGSALGGSIGGSFGLDTEKEILQSNLLVRGVVKEMGLYTEYRLCKWGRKTLLYQEQPLNVTIDPAHLNWLDTELPKTFHQIELTIKKNSDGYHLETMIRENRKKKYLEDQSFASLPAVINTEVGTITIAENKLLDSKLKEEYADAYKLNVVIAPPMEAANDFISKLSIDPPSKKVSDILAITLTDENEERAIDFINKLVEAYNKRANDDKNEEARKTDEFVNSRLARVDAELGSSDADWERYKKQFQITQPEVDAQEVMGKKSLYETELVEIGTQLQLHDYLNEYINDPANLYEIIPLSIGVSSVSAKGDNSAVATQSASLIAKHNEFVSQRKDFLKSMSEKAPQVERLTESIKELHPVIKTAMKRDRQSILMKRSNVEREYGKYMGRVGSAPQQERVLTEIGRQREIKQGVYLVMLQKREETAMELANVADKGKLVDETMVNKNSRKPNKKLILIAALFAGILLPLTLLSLLEMFKSIIVYRKDLESITDLPILGEVLINDDLENFRKIRTNLLLNVQPDNRVIMFASENDGDGKTYLAHHMVETLSQIGKSVLYLDLDLRNGKPEGNILPSEYINMNPADFFSHEEFGGLMAKYKSEYDYIVIDTPSIKEYTDAYQIANYVDATCFVVKSGKTPKQTIERITKSSIMPNISFIINAIDMSKKKYKFYYKYFLSMLVFPLIISSCGSSEKIAYVQNPDKMSNVTNQTLFDARIMPKDILTVTVTTIDPEAAVPFNLSVPTTVSQASTKTLTSQPVLQDYLVANDGTIDFPIIGEIKVAGLTKKECEAMILEKIRPYLAETEKPIVTVRMSSYSIAVLGEVKTPGSFPVSREKINIFEALAMAGDMTIYGVRDRVRLIREDAKGNKEIQILDLTDANIINSPYYYLQQNDIIYVEPSKVKKQDARVGSMTNLWFSATSILVSLASIIVTIAK